MSQIPATALLEGEVKMWLKMLHRRLSPRMKARSAWTVEFKRAMSSEIFSLILQMVKKARSAYGVVHNEEKHTDIIYYFFFFFFFVLSRVSICTIDLVFSF